MLTRPHSRAAHFANGDLGRAWTSLPSCCPPSYYLFFSNILYTFSPSGRNDARVSRTQPCCLLCYVFTDAHCHCSLAKGCQVFFTSSALLHRTQAHLGAGPGLIQHKSGIYGILIGQYTYSCTEKSFNKRAVTWGTGGSRTLSSAFSLNRDQGGMLMAAGAFPALPASPFDLTSSADARNLGKSQGWEGNAHRDPAKCEETGPLQPSPVSLAWQEPGGVAGSYLRPPHFPAPSKANASPIHLRRDFRGGGARLGSIPVGSGSSGFPTLLRAQLRGSKQQPTPV